MNEDFHLAPLPADTEMGDLLESLGPLGERPPESQYCVFRSGRERFCFPVLDVEEVLEWPLVTKLPLAPAYVLGIFNLRGAIVPLIDIAMTEGRRAGLLPRADQQARGGGPVPAEQVVPVDGGGRDVDFPAARKREEFWISRRAAGRIANGRHRWNVFHHFRKILT